MEAIYLEFNFFKKRSELLIADLIKATAANIGGATNYGTLNING